MDRQALKEDLEWAETRVAQTGALSPRAAETGGSTLNVLLSFAQFERELIGERVRDKIAASKRKGIWVGGPVPLGYAVTDRKIVVVPAEAEGRSATRIRAVVYSSAVCVRQGGLLERVAQYFKSGLPYGVWTGTPVSLGPQRGRRGL